MGFTSAFLAGTALSVISGLHSKNKMEKSQRSAEIAAREAAKRNVTVQSSGAESTRAESENESASYVAQQNAKKRRQGIASTVTDRALTSSLVGNKSLLGG
jgi:hypothetical protein